MTDNDIVDRLNNFANGLDAVDRDAVVTGSGTIYGSCLITLIREAAQRVAMLERLLREARELMDIHVPSEHGGDQVMCAIDDALQGGKDNG